MTDKEVLKLALEALDVAQSLLEKSRHHGKILAAYDTIKEALAQPAQERNFCSRCGKRTADLNVIHTCTPPQEKNNG
jgi:hypothetical protein